MTAETAAVLYASLAALPFVMHVALAAGAPLGRFTVGGRFPGRLPPLWRGLALVQAGLLLGMALVVLERGLGIDLSLPDLLFWPVLGLTVLTCIANAISPSRPERLLWTPVTVSMAGAILAVALP